jgi:asparagine synthase (glutamine-hydrolysing)
VCGISGFWDSRCGSSASELEAVAMQMADRLKHRGPDDAGVWADPDAGIALSMRRLAIIDLSAAGHQPMESAGGRYVLVFNGEIYNYEDLREDLAREEAAIHFRGTSDTEVMLAAFDKWGIELSLIRLNGMFAFAVWDRQERILTLGRDRFGEKPLYYSRVGRYFLFSSELKGLRAHPAFEDEVNDEALSLFLRYSCIPDRFSIYKGTRKLQPGHVLSISKGDFVPSLRAYWSLSAVIEKAIVDPLSCSEGEAVEQLDALLQDAVRIRMRSDVPYGAFLSGGVDSSTVVSLMQAQSRIPVKTFTIGNHDREFDESREAGKVARYLQTEHTELHVTAQEAMAVIPSLAGIYDEPFSDCCQIATILVSQLARKHVTVCLSGDGGDELFGGYHRHAWSDLIGHGLHHSPQSLRKIAATAFRLLTPDRWDLVFRSFESIVPPHLRQRMPGYKLHKMASVLEAQDSAALYERLSSHRFECQSILRTPSRVEVIDARNTPLGLKHTAEEMMYMDAVRYLPEDILVKLDRATMSVSLEGRVPFLDHRVAEFAWKLPLHMRIRRRKGKWILRQVLYRYVPREIVDRPKSGFGVPLATWLRGPLRDWAESLLHERRLRREGYFRPEPIQKMWHEHITCRANWEYHLWDLLMFQAWLDENRRGSDGDRGVQNRSAKAAQGSTSAWVR